MRSIFLLYCLVYFAARGQGGAATIKPHIDNNKTAAHVRVPGTRLFLIPPPHFTLSSWYSGFEKKEVAAIVVIDQPGGSYAASAGSFTKAELESRGVKVLDFRDLTINGFPARFAEVKGPGASKVFELVFGDPTFAAMVTASNKAGDDATGAALIGSLNSIVYDKKVKTDPFELAHFSVGSNTSVFKFFRSNGNMFIYSVGGADRSRDANAPVVLITQVPTQGALSPKSVVGQILQQEVRNGLSNPSLHRESNRKYNGLDAYEAEFDVTVGGGKGRLYYFAVSKGAIVVVFNGVAKSQIDKNVVEFRKLAYALRLK
ncbi:MAG TPA: hypothetical protein VN616_01360 [Puia sp.]|nr:hypothetical protein [Puia sp.]